MRLLSAAVLSLTLGLTSLQAQPQPKSAFFNSKEPMPVGAYYYPEHWPEEDWEPNLKKMASLGFKFTHIAEFAWDRIEPTEGNYDFGWIDKVLSIADKNGLKVIMCTPTPCPPTWMVRKYPEITVQNKNGLRRDQGGRRHGNHTNAKFLEFSRKVVEAMAKRYGNDPRVIGWQIDNEPHVEGLTDYSPDAVVAFRAYVKNKYGTIAKLNRAWGTPFWAQTYQNFEQINLPNPEANGVNHHQMVDFKLFTAQALADFLNLQADILKRNISKKQYVTTNYAYLKFLPEVNPFLTRKNLDFATYTMYLTNTWLEYPEGGLNYRLGSGLELSFLAEFVKSHSGYSGIMELQPGQINWGSYNAMPLPGAVRMWMWHNWGLNAQFINTYRFRQPVFGGEMFHKGIMETDGETVSPGGKEYAQVIKELAEINKHRSPDAEMPAELKAKNTAFLWKQENLLDFIEQPHVNRFSMYHAMYTWYQAAKASGAPVTVLTEEDAFDAKKYPIMMAPCYQFGSRNLLKRLTKYVEDGGHLVINARTFTKDSLGHLWKGLPAAPLKELIGAEIQYFDQLPPDRKFSLEMEGKSYQWGVYADILKPFAGTEVWAKHNQGTSYAGGKLQDPYYGGEAVITRAKRGKGSVTYCGTLTDDRNLEIALMKKVYDLAGAKPLSLPKYAFTEWRDGLYITVNYTSEAIQAPLKPGSKIILGTQEVLPGGVCVWRE